MAQTFHPVVQELIDMIQANGWQDKFEQALKKAQSYNVDCMEDIKTMDDFFKWCNAQLTWVPIENQYGTEVFNHICKFYFSFDQSPVKELQNPVTPSDKMRPLTELSAWMRKFVIELGAWLDTPESLTPESLASFKSHPEYHIDEYIEPRGGWKSYNQFFARSTKPGYRPIAAIEDQTVITSPADSCHDGQWEVRADSGVTIKGLHWKIEELLEGSPYADAFQGGIWIHQFLNPYDYHRQRAAVGGKVVEARVIQGTVYLQVTTEPIPGDPQGRNRLTTKRAFNAPDDPGYEFMQTRGLVVIDSPIGLVATLPMGMAQVSSIIMEAEVGKTLQKGEEISYFQFGGSDIVMVFQQCSNVSITAHPGVHYKVGTRIGKAYPAVPTYRK